MSEYCLGAQADMFAQGVMDRRVMFFGFDISDGDEAENNEVSLKVRLPGDARSDEKLEYTRSYKSLVYVFLIMMCDSRNFS